MDFSPLNFAMSNVLFGKDNSIFNYKLYQFFFVKNKNIILLF
jgi:hypothetical protein